MLPDPTQPPVIENVEVQTVRDAPDLPERIVTVTGTMHLPTREHERVNEIIAQLRTLLNLTYGPGVLYGDRSDDMLTLRWRWAAE